MSDRHATYRFGPRNRRGAIAGIRSGQLIVVTASLVVAVCWMRAVHSKDNGLVAFAVVCTGIGIAWFPIGGRTAEEWFPVVLRYVGDLLLRRQHDVVNVASPASNHVPSMFRPFSFVEAPQEFVYQPFGMVHDEQVGTWTAVLSLEGGSFALLGRDEQARQIDAWAVLLASIGKDVPRLHRLQWLQRTLPESGSDLYGRLKQAVTTDESNEQRDLRRARSSYARLLDREAAGAARHELLLAVSVQGPRRSALQRGNAKDAADKPAIQTLENEIAAVSRRCSEAGLSVHGVLSVQALRSFTQRSFASRPFAAPSSQPWPVAYAASWSSLCTDGTWHATYWIAEWPRSDVAAGFLNPLLVGSKDRRTVSVVMRPIPPLKATRAAERDKTSGVADAELRKRHGFATTARTLREHEGAVRREMELADGHVAYQFSGYVTVTATDRVELEQGCARIEQQGAAARLELRRLYGSQGEAFLCTLPFGRGCG